MDACVQEEAVCAEGRTQQVLDLGHGDGNGGASHEARHNGVRQVVRQPAQPQKPNACVQQPL